MTKLFTADLTKVQIVRIIGINGKSRAKLKRLVADLSLDKVMLLDGIKRRPKFQPKWGLLVAANLCTI